MADDEEREPEDLDRPPPFFPYGAEEEGAEVGDWGEPIEVQIEAVYQAQAGPNIRRFVLLTDGRRHLRIVIGPFEATQISLPLQKEQVDRPMTHDLIRSILERLGATLEKVVIDDLLNGTFYAKLYLNTADEQLILDSRPSDAIALAVRCGVPIYVADRIMDEPA